MFDKATSHTKAMLQKTEEEKRTLEKVNVGVSFTQGSPWLLKGGYQIVKDLCQAQHPWHPSDGSPVTSCCKFALFPQEINILQWEIEFDQDRFKNIEDTWTEKYDRYFDLHSVSLGFLFCF